VRLRLHGHLLYLCSCSSSTCPIHDMYIAIIKPKCKRGGHYHEKKTETLICLSGCGKIEINDTIETFVATEDNPFVYVVQPTVSHTIHNLSETEPLIIFVLLDQHLPEDKVECESH